MLRRPWIPTLTGLSATLLVSILAASVVNAQTYRVAKRVALPGDEGWDYLTVDPAAHRLYVTHASRVLVVDTERDSLVGEIPKTPGVHGVALVKDRGRGYISNGRDSSVTVFDLATLATLANVKIGARNPDAIAYDDVSK